MKHSESFIMACLISENVSFERLFLHSSCFSALQWTNSPHSSPNSSLVQTQWNHTEQDPCHILPTHVEVVSGHFQSLLFLLQSSENFSTFISFTLELNERAVASSVWLRRGIWWETGWVMEQQDSVFPHFLLFINSIGNFKPMRYKTCAVWNEIRMTRLKIGP